MLNLIKLGVDHYILLGVGLFGVFILVSGIIVLFSHAFGKIYFGDWNTLRLNIIRFIITGAIFAASTFPPPSKQILIAAYYFTFVTIFYFVMGRFQAGRNFVQSVLIDSHTGERIYALLILIPMGVLLVHGVFYNHFNIL